MKIYWPRISDYYFNYVSCDIHWYVMQIPCYTAVTYNMILSLCIDIRCDTSYHSDIIPGHVATGILLAWYYIRSIWYHITRGDKNHIVWYNMIALLLSRYWSYHINYIYCILLASYITHHTYVISFWLHQTVLYWNPIWLILCCHMIIALYKRYIISYCYDIS